MSVSLVLTYVGVTGIVGMAWPLLLLPLPVVGIDTIVIPFEESRLRDVLGAEFQDYCTRVRRWI
jgi:protein-S-isoprenylcysteine O-methyltransferase Ste14